MKSGQRTPDRILIGSLRFHGRHGEKEIEKKNGGWFCVDLEIETDFSDAAASDDLSRALDYEAVAAAVLETSAARRFNLMESLAEAIAARVLQFDRAAAVGVTVRKENPPVSFEFRELAVRIRRARNGDL